ncbi:MAG TPA: DUF2860 family protein [Geobacteraceae bacterium]
MTRLASLLFATTLFSLAATGPATAGDLRLRAETGVAVLNFADNLSGRGEQQLNSLNDKPTHKTRLFPLVLFDLRYQTADDGPTWFLNSTAAEPGSIAAGVSHPLAGGTLEGALFYNFIGSGWENPYVLTRTSTTIYTYGGRLKYDRLLETPLALTYRATVLDVATDVSGDLTPSLKRDGVVHRLALDWGLQLGANVTVTPGFAWERGAIDGEANRFDLYETSVAASYKTDQLLVNGRLAVGFHKYDAANPVFGVTRDETSYSAMASTTLRKPLPRWERVFMTIGGLYGHTDANLPFFTKDQAIAFADIGYRFY